MNFARDLRLMADRAETTPADARMALGAAAMIEGQQALIDRLMGHDDHAASAALMSAQHSIGGLDE